MPLTDASFCSIPESQGFADSIPEWPDDDLLQALRSFAAMADSVKAGGGRLAELHREASCGLNKPAAWARTFFEANFAVTRLGDTDGSGFVTGYYEPVLPASLAPTARFRFPLYAPPPELRGTSKFHDRAAIEAGALAGRGLEIAYLDSLVDAYIVHVQGSAVLELPDGSRRRLTYSDRNGHPYRSIGKLLVENGEISAGEMTADKLRTWLEIDPERGARLMNRNPSYIFFRWLAADGAPGPTGAAGVPLVAGRSLAVDPDFVAFGTPVWIRVRKPVRGLGKPFSRLMIAQDAGSAIKGAGRGDIFFGTGKRAGEIAGSVKHACDFLALLPRETA